MVVNVDGFTYPCCEYLSKCTRQTNKGVKTPDLTNNNVNKMKRQKSQCITGKEAVESTNALYHSIYIQSCIRDPSVVDSGLK